MPQWILPPASCEFLAEIARILPAGSTGFEFGSGRSTHVLRHNLSGVTSVEDSRDWLEKTETLPGHISRRPADHPVVVPLTRCWNRLRLIQSFHLEAHAAFLQHLKTARLILVDSPPNPAKREHALYIALRHAPAGAIIVIDDLEVGATARFAERLARQNAVAFRFWALNIDHRLGVFLKRDRSGRIRSCPSAREFIGTWLRA
ncbi:MAG: hypothetical protein ACJ8KU_12015 [Chthoniobacterales bacterium]